MSGKGDSYRKLTPDQRKAFEDNFDAIFGKKNKLCDICGKDSSTVKECAWTGCPSNWDETRIDRIGSNGDGFPDKSHYDN